MRERASERSLLAVDVLLEGDISLMIAAYEWIKGLDPGIVTLKYEESGTRDGYVFFSGFFEFIIMVSQSLYF